MGKRSRQARRERRADAPSEAISAAGSAKTRAPSPGDGASSARRFRVRYGVLGWFALALAGALNGGTIAPGLLDSDGWLVAIFPHTRWGYVMFNKAARKFPVITYRRPGEEVDRRLAELNPTPAPGYAQSRAELNFFFRPRWLEHVCRKNPEAHGAAIAVATWVADPAWRELGVDRLRCDDGVLRDDPAGRGPDALGR
jgi:hypothetical protein